MEKESTMHPGDTDSLLEPAADNFAAELQKSLDETEREAKKLSGEKQPGNLESWNSARDLVQNFRPVPWFIWRLSNFVFGRTGEIKPIKEGLVLGMKRLLCSAASDPFFSDHGRVTTIPVALSVLKPDVVAALSVIHAICRKLASCQFDRIWRPILDDALLRAQIGYFAGERKPQFGPGRGMLAGFAGRCGLAILIATGNLEQARQSLEKLATGADISEVGMLIYGCDPLQISAMTLSASGCGTDAAFGTANYAVSRSSNAVKNKDQLHWLSAFTIVELVRMGKDKEIAPSLWEDLGYLLGQDRGDFIEVSRTLVRQGHTLAWIL